MIAQTYPLWAAWTPSTDGPAADTPEELAAHILAEQSARVIGWTTPGDSGSGEGRVSRSMTAAQLVYSRPVILSQGKGHAHEFRADEGFQVFYAESLRGAVALAVGYAYQESASREDIEAVLDGLKV